MRFLKLSFYDAAHVKAVAPIVIAMDNETWRNVATLDSIIRFIGHTAFTRCEVQRDTLTPEQEREAISIGTRLFGVIHHS
jgi:hypothetical protein